MDREKELEVFANDVKKTLEELTGEDVVLEKSLKNNGMVLHGVHRNVTDGCAGAENKTATTVFVESFYKDFKSGKTITDIAEKIVEIWEANVPDEKIVMENFRDVENIRSRVMYKLINYGYNLKLLAEVPHERFLDLAKVYYISVKTKDDVNASLLVQYRHLNWLGITEEELKECAERNTPYNLPVRISRLGEVMRKATSGMKLDPEEEKLFDQGELYIGYNKSGMYGAAVLCYPGVIGEFAEEMESDLLIIPSSLHEIIIVPVNEKDDIVFLKQLVFEINRTQLSWDEVLSDSVYYYDIEKQELIVV